MQLIFASNQDITSDEVIGNEITSDEVIKDEVTNDDIIDDGLTDAINYKNLIVDPKGAVEQVVYNSVIRKSSDSIGKIRNEAINSLINETNTNNNHSSNESMSQKTISPPLLFSMVPRSNKKFEVTNSGWIMIGFIIMGLNVLLVIRLC